jgi:hypothetical protein
VCVSVCAGQVEAQRRAVAGLKKELGSLEKRLKKLQAGRDARSPELIRAKAELGKLLAREAGRGGVAEARKEAAELEKKLKALQAALKKLTKGAGEGRRRACRRAAHVGRAVLGCRYARS